MLPCLWSQQNNSQQSCKKFKKI
uniref:Uncharacterized protein n=1 Tax=Anguilla anguilla TaxID=7936 RepID=A0A0E9U5F1_ANGAN